MTKDSLELYRDIVAPGVLERLVDTGARLKGLRLVHVNSTRIGGGVAEILNRMLPLMNELGIDASWEVIEGDPAFYGATKAFHNGLQGDDVPFTREMVAAYEATNERNAQRLRPILEAADFVIIHDPQPAPLLALCPNRKGSWVWRCHIDAGHPAEHVWEILRPHVEPYAASIYHVPEFARDVPHETVIMPPSIDPLSAKNADVPEAEVASLCAQYNIDRSRPLAVQVSRFDRFKDPLGVIEACRLASADVDVQCVLAGGGADDDPEGADVLAEVRAAAAGAPSTQVLLLPPDAHRTINILQRAATVVLQKSLKEGFGLTVSEAMWKGRPVIGGDVGGIRLQVIEGETGYLVRSPEEAAKAIVAVVSDDAAAAAMGARAKEHVRQNFLITQHVQNYLNLVERLL